MGSSSVRISSRRNVCWKIRPAGLRLLQALAVSLARQLVNGRFGARPMRVDLVQLAIALLILANRLTAYAGYGLFALYGLAFWHYGALHLLDYAYLLGAGYYLVAMGSPRKKVRASALPGLYASVGFSLCWVALEKLFYPQWGLEILQERPFLTLGFEPGFF